MVMEAEIIALPRLRGVTGQHFLVVGDQEPAELRLTRFGGFRFRMRQAGWRDALAILLLSFQ